MDERSWRGNRLICTKI